MGTGCTTLVAYISLTYTQLKIAVPSRRYELALIECISEYIVRAR